MSSLPVPRIQVTTPTPPYRVTIFMGWAGDGASESYLTPAAAPATLITQINRMLNLRSQCMFDTQYIQGVRISQYGNTRRSTLLLPLGGPWPDAGNGQIVVPAKGGYIQANYGTPPTEFRAVLQVRIGFDNPVRYATKYLSGIPSAMIQAEPATISFGGAPSFLNAMNAFYTYLQSNLWQIGGTNLAAGSFQIVGVVQQSAAPNLLGVQIAAATSPSITQGQRVKIQGTRPAKGTRGATINGRWSVASVDQTGLPNFVTVYLQNSQLVVPSMVRLTGATSILQPVVPLTFPISNYNIFRAGIKKRGKPSLSPRGRRLTRYTLDP
jgi:hypothetical protein